MQLNIIFVYCADERQQMSLAWDRAPLVHARPNSNLTWEGTYISKFTITKDYIAKPGEIGGNDGQFHLPGFDLTNGIDIQHHHKSNSSLPSKGKGTAAEILNQGLFCFHFEKQALQLLH